MVDKSYSLPNMEFSFKYQGQGKETGINWVGDFKYRRPSLGARSRIAALRTRLNGEQTVDDQEAEEFNHAIAYLRYTLIEYPDWWVDSTFGMELYDGNVVSEIYNKCMEFEAEWKKKVHSGDGKDVEAGMANAHSPEELVRDAEGAPQQQ